MKIEYFKLIFLILFCFSINSYLYAQDKNLFATVEKDDYKIVADTVKYKSFLKKYFYPNEEDVSFDKISIKKQYTVGERKELYYFILAESFKSNIRLASWLEKEDSKLYRITEADLNNKNAGITVSYLACQGQSSCTPNVSIIEGEKYWGCSDRADLACGFMEDCKASTMIISE
ncbi:hypothetical protein [Mesonia maritima]|uniref:Uncharacterized protein n=1 Tax=Mesonia maritima TaxID=1793873 RepID=A0ABU1K371_9FLAO|nr:hypothetical protein [Mesonia maritima]MDR6300060.1 hypothetical protein [Mesonia maritima]